MGRMEVQIIEEGAEGPSRNRHKSVQLSFLLVMNTSSGNKRSQWKHVAAKWCGHVSFSAYFS